MKNPNAPIGTSANPLVYAFPADYTYDPLYDWQNDVEFDPFWLVFPTFGPMTAGLASTQIATIPNDADFECRRGVYHVDAAAAQLTVGTLVIPNMTILITDSGSGRNLMNAAAPLASVLDNETNGETNLVWPKIFTRNSQISITLTNFDAAATTNSVRITLCGRKIFSRN